MDNEFGKVDFDEVFNQLGIVDEGRQPATGPECCNYGRLEDGSYCTCEHGVRELNKKEESDFKGALDIAAEAVDKIVPRKYAGIELSHYRDNVDPLKKDAIAAAFEFAAGEADYINLIIAGPYGTGKTQLACSILRHMILEGYSGLFWQFDDLLSALRPNGNDDHRDIVRQCQKVGVLIIDDIGSMDRKAKASDFVSDVGNLIVNHRGNWLRPTIFTTNLSKGDLYKQIGQRFSERLYDNCKFVELAGGRAR